MVDKDHLMLSLLIKCQELWMELRSVCRKNGNILNLAADTQMEAMMLML